MIPPHRPAFGIWAVTAATLFPRVEARELRRCEEQHAAASGCAQAVWLPSGRAGIGWALRAAINADAQVVGPAFTCSVVHEAMVRSSGRAVMVDAAGDGFGMDEAALRDASTGNYALVLSEPYGHPYDLELIAQRHSTKPRIRIVDSAMAVPHRSLFDRITGNDFAVVSFGAGKNSYAGWGAMGFTRDAALANEVRMRRDHSLAAASAKLSWQRGLSIGLRTAAQNPLVFSATRKLWYWAKTLRAQPLTAETPSRRAATGFPAAWSDDRACSAEWRLPSTHVDRALALKNLDLADTVHARRLKLAQSYREHLAGVPGLQLPPVSPFALSHFTVRVAANVRQQVKERLYRCGVYTISLWAFNAHLSPQQFPNAFRLCSEVINLPLSPWMNERQVAVICGHLRDCLSLAR